QTDEEDTANEAIDKTADLLRRELATPLGHVALECRALLRAGPSQPHEVTCQVFGMHRISWPRRALTRSAASQLCTQIVSRWNSKDAAPIKEAVQESVADLWARSQLDGEPLMSQLQTACEQALGNT